jgi:hypothetical protein
LALKRYRPFCYTNYANKSFPILAIRPCNHGFTCLRIAVLSFVAVLIQPLAGIADSLPLEHQTLSSRPLILVQTFEPEHCKARCQRTYNFCLKLVDELASGPLRGEATLQQLQRDRCEANSENCVRNCLR